MFQFLSFLSLLLIDYNQLNGRTGYSVWKYRGGYYTAPMIFFDFFNDR